MRQLLRQNNSSFSTTSLKRWCCLSFFFLFFFFLILTGHAKPVSKKEIHTTLVEYLVHEKKHLEHDIDIIKQMKMPTNGDQYHSISRQITSLLTINDAKVESLEGFLDNQLKQKSNLNLRLKNLQQLPLTEGGISIQERVSRVEALLTLNDSTMSLITDNLNLAKQFQVVLNDKVKELEVWNEHFQLEQKLDALKKQKKQLNDQLVKLYQNNSAPSDKGHLESNSNTQIGYEANVLVNNQYIALIHLQLHSLTLQKAIIKAEIVLNKNLNTKTLQSVIDAHNESIKQYTKIEHSLQQMLVFLKNEATLGLDKKLVRTINSLQVSLNEQIKYVITQKQILLKNLADYQAEIKKLISSRQSLSEYNMNSWPIILDKMMGIPGAFYKYIKTLTLKTIDSFLWLGVLAKVLLGVVLFSFLISSYFLNRFLKTTVIDKERTSLSGYLYDGALTILQRNIPYLCLFAMTWSFLYFTNISYVNYQLLFNLVAIWLTFRVLILIARLVLLERISDSSGKDVKLYYRVKWLLLFGGWATAFMTFSHLLPLSLILQDIFNRLFMLFILSVSLVAWKSKDVIPYLLGPLLKGKKRYFKNAISLLVFLIPITLFTTALIGLLGYVNLAWTMSRYQAYMVLVLVGYILSRGLLFDALELFSEWMITSLNNGWLWIEVFLKPIDKILRVVLLLVSAGVLFQLFGWKSDSVVILILEQFAQYTIINLTGIHITVASLIEFFILLTVFAWAARWTREFCYRWLYKKTKDAGVRNSLSVFTQYSVILLGSFITLRVLGIDFSGMSVIIGGLAVGMGFGLRDFASNVVGGIMLLIERPVREGDLISIGEYEGQVSHIGIRSMRVSSWDNTEVLIPNAETFNKPFTNWTHQDGIVRTVIPIKVSRSDDPVMIQQLILDVLAIIPEIVSDPPVQVFLKKIDEALIEFEARYFINVQIHNRVEVRSKVLFAITAQFKAAGVRPPVEPITVELKEGHGDLFNKQKSTTD